VCHCTHRQIVQSSHWKEAGWAPQTVWTVRLKYFNIATLIQNFMILRWITLLLFSAHALAWVVGSCVNEVKEQVHMNAVTFNTTLSIQFFFSQN